MLVAVDHRSDDLLLRAIDMQRQFMLELVQLRIDDHGESDLPRLAQGRRTLKVLRIS